MKTRYQLWQESETDKLQSMQRYYGNMARQQALYAKDLQYRMWLKQKSARQGRY